MILADLDEPVEKTDIYKASVQSSSEAGEELDRISVEDSKRL